MKVAAWIIDGVLIWLNMVEKIHTIMRAISVMINMQKQACMQAVMLCVGSAWVAEQFGCGICKIF